MIRYIILFLSLLPFSYAQAADPVPATPTNTQVIQGDGNVSLSWDSVNYAQEYVIYYKQGTSVSASDYDARIVTSASPYTITGLINGNTYAVAVSASNSSGESAISTPEVVTLASDPSNLSGLLGLAMEPNDPIAAIGESVTFRVIGTFSDGSKRDVTFYLSWMTVGGITWDAASKTATVTTAETSIITATEYSSGLSAWAFLYGTSYANEGTYENPVELQVNTTHSGSVNAGGPYSYYSIATTAGMLYHFDTYDTSPYASWEHLSFQVYDDAGYTNLVCQSESIEWLHHNCEVIAPGTALYIRVDGSGTIDKGEKGASFDLTLSEGFEDERKTLSSLPYQGQVGEGVSIYEYSVIPTARYQVTLTTNNPDIRLVSGNECTESADLRTHTCIHQSGNDLITITVDNTGSGYGGTFSLDITMIHDAYTSEGTYEQPKQITTASYSGEIDYTADSYYEIPVTAGKSYELSLTSEYDLLYVEFFDGSVAYAADTAKCGFAPGRYQVQKCRFEPVNNGSIFVRVGPQYPEYSQMIGSGFTLELTEIVYNNEGYSYSPVILNTLPDSTTYSGQVNTGASYYQLPVEAGHRYIAEVTNMTADVNVSIYADANLNTLLCSSNNPGTEDEACLTTNPAPSDSLWVVVSGSSSLYGAKFDLNVNRRYESEASQLAPKDLTGQLPYSGEVGPTNTPEEYSHYSVQVTPGKSYRIRYISGTDNNVVIDVHDMPNEAILDRECYVGGYRETCDMYPVLVDTLYITARAPNTNYGAAFSFTIEEIEYVSEGSVGAPMNMTNFPVMPVTYQTLGSSINGATGYGSSYYQIDVSTADSTLGYKVSLNNQSADANLYVYADPGYTNLLCSSVNGSNTNESCEIVTQVTTLYIQIDGTPSGFGSVYNLVVDYDYVSEGTPVVGKGKSATGGAYELAVGVAHNGEVKKGSTSYYSIPVQRNGTYTITFSGMNNDVCYVTYPSDDGTFTSTRGPFGSTSYTQDKSVVVTTKKTVLYFTVESCGSANATGSAFTVTVTQN